MARKNKANGAAFKIEKGLPIPSRRGGSGSKYPWAEMLKGDSFLSNKSAVSASASWQRKHPDVKFLSRKVKDGIRIWRTK